MITLKPSGGLGNRMRVLSSARSLQKTRGDRLFIIWDQSHVLNCPFEHLFVAPTNVSVKNIRYGKLRRIRRLMERALHLRGLRRLGYDLTIDNDMITNKAYRDEDLSDKIKFKKILIETYKPFYDTDRMHFFDFNPSVIERADQISRQFSDLTVGVHVRRGDHQRARTGSPLHSFIKLMEDEIEMHQEAAFYLATDSDDVEHLLREKFGRRIIFNDQKVNNRTTSEGVTDALVDMICLSRSAKILGSYKSTFSIVASEIGSVPLVIAGSKSP